MIMFFRVLELPLAEIRKILDHEEYDKTRVLAVQKAMLEKKRNHLNGIIQLITDVMKGDNTMSFEAFNEKEIQKIIDHTLQNMSKEALETQMKQHGGLEEYRRYLMKGFQNEQAMTDVLKWYGGKEKALEAVLSSTGVAGGEYERNEQLAGELTNAMEKAAPHMFPLPSGGIMGSRRKWTDKNLNAGVIGTMFLKPCFFR